jgi:hypothetical protein
MKIQSVSGFPWDIWASWEVSQWNSVPSFIPRFLISFGFLPFLAIPAYFFNKHVAKSNFKFIALWAATPFILLPFIELTGVSKYRVINTVPFVPLSILSTITLRAIYEKSKKSGVIIFAALFIYNIATTGYIFSRYLNYYDLSKVKSKFMHYYVPSAEWKAVEFLEKNAPIGAHILSGKYMGGLYPAHAPVISYIGHTLMTKNYFEKDALTARFYAGSMTTQEAHDFLESHQIQFVIYGWEEKKFGQLPDYPFLTPVFNTEYLTVYQVRI